MTNPIQKVLINDGTTALVTLGAVGTENELVSFRQSESGLCSEDFLQVFAPGRNLRELQEDPKARAAYDKLEFFNIRTGKPVTVEDKTQPERTNLGINDDLEVKDDYEETMAQSLFITLEGELERTDASNTLRRLELLHMMTDIVVAVSSA